MSELFGQQLAYRSLNTVRSALSSLGIIINGFAIGQHPLVIKFMKGVFNLRPPRSRYTEIWDVSKVLSYIKTMQDDEVLTLKLLTLKLTMLVALTQASRTQSLHLLSIENLRKGSDSYVLQYNDMLKQCRPGRSIPVVHLKLYLPDRRICVFRTLTEYLRRTESLRKDCKLLFISFRKPHGEVGTSTISRWLRTIMTLAGIDCNRFKSHSVRAAATSKAKQCNVPVKDILKVAGWSNERTFATYYDKDIQEERVEFAESVLSQ